ncbi:MAG: ketoacyl-ACP synthase III [Phycisphaeraceae bacterium]|nr:ketoacyl-ACP synthase III [Phycisphaeraceae bacterium]
MSVQDPTAASPGGASAGRVPPPPAGGVTIAGTGLAVPQKRLTNQDLERLMDTSDEWIVQRTGIRQRHVCDFSRGESTYTIAAAALRNACDDAKIDPATLDLVLVATMSMESTCPPSACRVAAALGTRNAGAFDLSAACCGFVFGLNTAYGLMRSGQYRRVGLVGADTLSRFMDYSNAGRSTAILFGDGAGAAILTATDDPTKGVIAQAMHSDGARFGDLYIPEDERGYPEGVEHDPAMVHRVQMNGQGVFKFAVGTFPDVIAQTLDKAGLAAGDVDMYVCHQSNARILDAARKRFGLAEDRLYVNIDRYANTVAASVPLCLHELRAAGRVRAGHKVMFVGFGGGLTWGTSLWQL